MCLTINKKFKSFKSAKAYFDNPLIAEKEFPVYKVLESVNKNKTKGLSPFQTTEYKKGFQYTNDYFNGFYKNEDYKVAFLSENKTEIKNSLSSFSPTNTLSIEQGLHAYVTKNNTEIKEHLECWLDTCVIEMWVPKGAKYFLGTKDEIVTNSLIWY